MTLSPEQINNTLEQPELAVHLADLVCIQYQHLTIHRKKHGRGYSYLLDNKTRLADNAEVKRIKEWVTRQLSKKFA